MSQIGVLKYSYLAYFSQPTCDRSLYRVIRDHLPTRILEIGIGAAIRAERMIAVAASSNAGAQVTYIGVGMFEAGQQTENRVSLKQAYQQLRRQGAQVQLVPSDAHAGLSSIANDVRNLDLVVIATEPGDLFMESAWPFLPRMLKTDALVYELSRDGRDKTPLFRRVSQLEIHQRSARRRLQKHRPAA